MPSMWGWENRDGWFRYTVSLARLPARNDIGRLQWRKLNDEILSLDDIYVGRECINRCSLHGDCRVCKLTKYMYACIQMYRPNHIFISFLKNLLALYILIFFNIMLECFIRVFHF